MVCNEEAILHRAIITKSRPVMLLLDEALHFKRQVKHLCVRVRVLLRLDGLLKKKKNP